MRSPLYLDTARLGLMAPQVRDVLYSLAQLASVEGLSSRFDDFLHGGFQAWSPALQEQYLGLADWQGIHEFKHSLRCLIGLSADKPVFLASRSTSLMKVAARLMFQRCRRVLLTDLEWPGYVEILKQERQRVGGEIVEVPIRTDALLGKVSADELSQRVVDYYRRSGADGVFLSVVSFQGIRLPVADIARVLEGERTPPQFVVLDGAQAVGHIPPDFGLEHCDLLLAGCHKWLRSHNPLGLGFCIRRRSHEYIRLTMEAMARSWEADDPLLAFTTQLEGDALESFSETVSLMGMFSARAALADRENEAGPVQFRTLLDNSRILAEATIDSGWTPFIPHPSVQSGIQLFQAENSAMKALAPKPLRDHFHESGIALSSYQEGIVRVSLPKAKLTAEQIQHFAHALAF